MKESWIVYAKRTPIGKMGGGLSTILAPRLGAGLVKDFLETFPGSKEGVDELFMGNVLTAGIGQAPARQAAIYGGLPYCVPCTTVNKVCGSGLQAAILAEQQLRLGEAELVLAGGQENMSLAPHLLPGARSGYRFGAVEVKDSMQWDGLWDPYQDAAMGHFGDLAAKTLGFSREEQDAFALQSYQKAREATQVGAFQKELVPVEVSSRKGTQMVSQDEEPFSVDLDRLSSLRPAFSKDGTVTAANASSINDGAALLAICSQDYGKKHNLKPLAKILAHAHHAQQPQWFTTAPIKSTQAAVRRAGLTMSDVDLFEINEAFSVVTLAAIRDLDLDPAAVNIRGGAASLGHPIGASGARILVTLVHALKAKEKRYGCASICIGGGEASSLLIENIE